MASLEHKTKDYIDKYTAEVDPMSYGAWLSNNVVPKHNQRLWNILVFSSVLQRITGKMLGNTLKMFGQSISGGIDVDGNGFPGNVPITMLTHYP